MRRNIQCMGCMACIVLAVYASAETQAPVKRSSSLYPAEAARQVKRNATVFPWATTVRDQLVERAKPWLEKSDDALWDLMFGPGITRSWMVWSNGFCPSCKAGVPMYTWKMDAMKEPWKVRCPHCEQAFPTNDFEAYYRSGLNEQGVFDPSSADRGLLFNASHPDANDPLRGFGVDDGEGYVEGENRWRFIGAYLIYGQWKQAVLEGIRVLSAAYLFTGDPAYAYKSGILLDRVADVYPGFDFKTQGLVYERAGSNGYVSTWHDACEETRELVMSYDMVFEAIRADSALTAFLSKKAATLHLENPKSRFEDIQRNIEERILRDALSHRPKITTNYPRTEIAEAIILAVLGWPENRDLFYGVVDPMLEKATAVDGVTGEKGMTGYTSYTIQALALFLEEFCKADPGFLEEVYRRHPRLYETYRFHIDMQSLGRYYPQTGDTGSFAEPYDAYVGMQLYRPGEFAPAWTLAPPSCNTLLWRLSELSGDPAFIQIAYRENGRQINGLPYDLYAADGEAIRKSMRDTLKREGMDVCPWSVNKQEWHLGILRSGTGKQARAVWLDYDSGGGHGHHDGMNMGFFANRLDLMPEFGYPPVQFGGWGSPKAQWYTMTAAHNTVTVDGHNTAAGAGETTLWGDGQLFHVLRASGPLLNGGNRYERTVALVDVDAATFYVLDVFRVDGGQEHIKYMQSHFGTLEVPGLKLQPVAELTPGTQMRAYQLDPAPPLGWYADWSIDDRFKARESAPTLHMRYTDMTIGAEAGTAEGWFVKGGYNTSEEDWIARLAVRRRAAEGQTLSSTFVGVMETYETQPTISKVERISLSGPDGAPLPDSHVGLWITLCDGRRDLLLFRDPAVPGESVLSGPPGIRTDGEACLFRFSAEQRLTAVTMCNGKRLNAPGLTIDLADLKSLMEWAGQ